jgi:hypothetical protein
MDLRSDLDCEPYPSDMDGLKQNPRGEQIKEDGKKEKRRAIHRRGGGRGRENKRKTDEKRKREQE